MGAVVGIGVFYIIDAVTRLLNPNSCKIEGYGGHALSGARSVLKRTRYVVTETHGPDEMALMSRVLFEEGFTPFQLSSRSLWWRKA